MGCCGEPVEESNRSYDSTPTGPVKRRGCTDIACLLVFVGFLIGWGIVAAIAFINGDPNHLFNPTDSEGNICGVGKLEAKKYLFYFDLMQCSRSSVFISGCATPQVCVSKCPTYNYAALDPSADLLKNKNYLICKYNINIDDFTKNDDLRTLINKGDCAPYYISSSSGSESLDVDISIFDDRPLPKFKNPLFGRCLPEFLNQTGAAIVDIFNHVIKTANDTTLTPSLLTQASKLLMELMNAGDVLGLMYSDFKSSWWLIVIGLVLAMVLSFFWVLLIRLLGGAMIWFTLIAMLVVFGLGCGFSFYKYKDLESIPGSDATFRFSTDFQYYLQLRTTWLVFGIVAAIFLFFVLLIVIFLRKRISLAIALINESSKAVAQIPFSLLFPIIPFVFQLGILGFWVIVAVYLASMGEPTYRATLNPNPPPQCVDMYQHSDLSCNMSNFDPACGQCAFFTYFSSGGLIGVQVYNIVGWVWFIFFLDGLSQLILAGAFMSWYWSFNKPKDIPSCPLAASICRTFSFHLGTIAFGSLIIAIVRLIRIFLEFLDRKLKQHADNAFVKCVMCCLKCCFWCLETFLKYINKNAYIMVAMYGKNFCSSSKEAFSLLTRNVVRAVVLDKVTDFLLFIGKLVLVGGVGVLSFFFFSNQIPIDAVKTYVPVLNYYFVPVIVIVFGTYMVASAFFGVYEMAVDTIFLCFLEDCERNDGSPTKPYFMSKNLMKILGKQNKRKAE